MTALAALPNGRSKPVAGREFFLLAVDPIVLKAQIEREIPLPEDLDPSAKKSLAVPTLKQSDIQRVAQEFKITPECVVLAEKAPQDGSMYRDESRYRRLEDYAQVEELRRSYDSLLKKKVKKGNLSNLTDSQKLELVKALDTEFDRLLPSSKTAVAVRLAQLVVERENRAYAERRQQVEKRNAALAQRAKREEELWKELEQKRKLFRTSSDARGLARFSKLSPGNYWAYAHDFTFEGIATSWNIPIPLRRDEVKRIEVMIGNN
ncbi:MAG: hypothetical protein LAO31_07460 [Acidobacteriia bacterium]|nr:hypothetical protein [Terriglobia bacterium]